jgi:hypothetical protein
VRAIKKTVLLTTLTALLLSVVFFAPMCQAEYEWVVGVNVGDWFKYKGTLVEYDADEGVPFPPNSMLAYLVTYNESEWFSRTVINVSGTTITWDAVTHWKNGSETTSTSSDDIASSLWHSAIGANMEVGDQVAAPFAGILSECIIDETVDWEYEDTTRAANHAWKNGTGMNTYLQYYWDKATGANVKYISEGTAVTAQGNATYYAVGELIDSGVWVVPESHTWTAMLLMATASTISIVLYKRRKLFIKN